MKFSDLDNELLTEAPPGGTQGKLSRAATKIKKKVGPTKKMRQRATGKAEFQQQALDIKNQFHEWAGGRDLATTAKSLRDFFLDPENNYGEKYADAVEQTAVKLKFEQPGFLGGDEEPTPDPEGEGTPKAGGDEVDGDNLELEKDDEPKDAKGEQSEEEVRAVYGKQGDELEAKRKAQGGELADESVEEDADDAEPKVDMSASIYESRLSYFLIEDTKLKDNQLDTLLVRLLQAVGTSGGQAAPADKETPEKEKSNFVKKMNKAGKAGQSAMRKLGKAAFGDLVGGGDEGGSGGLDYDRQERRALEKILKTIVANKELSKQDRENAAQLLKEL